MDWIKVLNRHIIHEYNDLSPKEFEAWIKLMSLCAYLEHEPTHEQMLQYVHHKTITSLQEKLKNHSTTLQDIFKKVLIDAQEVLKAREYSKQRMKKYRALKVDVTRNVTVTLPNREEKRREEKNIKKDICSLDFEKFWSAYPKHTGKKPAFQEWEKAKDKPPLETILSAIENQKRAKQTARDAGQFAPEWPDPERWIKKARWEDETETQPETGSLDDWARRKQAEIDQEKNNGIV